MTDPLGGLKESIQDILKPQLLRTWKEGMRDGLQLAATMVRAVGDECARRLESEELTDIQREALAGQKDVCDGLAEGMVQSAGECMTLSDRSVTVVNETSNIRPAEGDKP